MDYNGCIMFHLKTGTYNKTRLCLDYFSLIVLDFKYA